MPFDFSDDERRKHFLRHVAASGRSAANNVGAFFKATFDAWKDYRRSGRERIHVGYSPAFVVDAALMITQMPNAHVLHVVRNPWSAYADTRKRPVPLPLASYMLCWSVNQHFALLNKKLFPDRMHIVRIEDVMANPRSTFAPVCDALGIEAGASLDTPSWNGTKLDQVYPWGTIHRVTPEANRSTAAELSADEQAEVRQHAGLFLKPFGYDDFLEQ
jgi:hypothetical protein